jgi:hypothetical protein
MYVSYPWHAPGRAIEHQTSVTGLYALQPSPLGSIRLALSYSWRSRECYIEVAFDLLNFIEGGKATTKKVASLIRVLDRYSSGYTGRHGCFIMEKNRRNI